jgi:ABC-2 type transport system ATP-binding protein
MRTDAALIGSGIVKRFGKRLVLDGAELVLRPDEVVALVGENGAGKTSLLRICAGLLAADAGTLERRGRIGYCPQQPARQCERPISPVPHLPRSLLAVWRGGISDGRNR